MRHDDATIRISNGGVGAGRILLPSPEISGSPANIDVSLPGGYSQYEVILQHIIPTVDASDLSARASIDGGTTFDSGASTYGYVGWELTSGGTNSFVSNLAATSIVLNRANSATRLGTGANEQYNSIFKIFPGNGSEGFHMVSDASVVASNGNPQWWHVIGQYIGSAARVTDVRFICSNAFASGTVKVYGIL